MRTSEESCPPLFGWRSDKEMIVDARYLALPRSGKGLHNRQVPSLHVTGTEMDEQCRRRRRRRRRRHQNDVRLRSSPHESGLGVRRFVRWAEPQTILGELSRHMVAVHCSSDVFLGADVEWNPRHVRPVAERPLSSTWRDSYANQEDGWVDHASWLCGYLISGQGAHAG
jgi:hypothetical protein